MGLDAWLHDSHKNEIIYWRKENHFHKFFCENGASIPGKTDEWTGPYIISRKVIKELIRRIDIILTNKLDTPITKKFSNGEEFIVEYDETIANEWLPTQEGFFYGEIEYTPRYFQSLIKTKDVISCYLIEHPRARKFIYISWW